MVRGFSLGKILQRSVALNNVSARVLRFHSESGKCSTHSAETIDPTAFKSAQYIDMEKEYSAHNYSPLPVVITDAEGEDVWNPESKRYTDFLSAYSAMNQGHGHPSIINALVAQSHRVTLTSRAFHNDKFPLFARHVTQLFGYDMMLPMNTGAEGVETAIKLARKWAYQKKGVPKGKALIVSCCGCFHGRTMAAISMSCDNDATRDFWPLLPGQVKVDFGDLAGLEKVFQESSEEIAGFILEPIQGEAGVIIPPDGYLKEVRRLCSEYNVLMIADEIQTGIARTGKMLAVDWEDVRPDIVILGKALGGGVYPVSCVLADKDIMMCIHPGEHGSTFGGNPLGCAVALASLEVIQNEQLADRAAACGAVLRDHLGEVQRKFPEYIKEVRGRGLLNAVEMQRGVSAHDVCMALKDRGVLAKPTHKTIIRLSPPLNIRMERLKEAAVALEEVLSLDMAALVERAAGRADEGVDQPCDRCGRLKG